MPSGIKNASRYLHSGSHASLATNASRVSCCFILVSRFRSSPYLAAHPDANFGIGKDTSKYVNF